MVTQGQNHIDSPANMLQQQHSYEVSTFYFIKKYGKYEKTVAKFSRLIYIYNKKNHLIQFFRDNVDDDDDGNDD